MLRSILLLFLMPLSLLASTSFYKCTVKGVTVYSEKPCSVGAVKSRTKDAYIGEKTKEKPKTAEQQLQNFLNNKTHKVSKKKKYKKMSACEGVSSLKLRNAAIKEQLMKCHSEKDVISIYGSPSHTKTYSNSNHYDQRWKYRFDYNKGGLYVYFKEGLVTKWATNN